MSITVTYKTAKYSHSTVNKQIYTKDKSWTYIYIYINAHSAQKIRKNEQYLRLECIEKAQTSIMAHLKLTDELDLDNCVESTFLYKLCFDFLKYDFHSFKWRSFLKFQIIKYCTAFSHHNILILKIDIILLQMSNNPGLCPFDAFISKYGRFCHLPITLTDFNTILDISY